MTDFAHMTTLRVDAPAERVFDFLSDPIRLGRWSLGCFQTEAAEQPGVFTGLSLFDGGRGWYSIEADRPRLAIDYLVGAPDRLVRRIAARIMDGPPLDHPAGSCLVSLMAWRPANMGEERWRRLCASHEAEIWLIKAQIEASNSPWPGR